MLRILEKFACGNILPHEQLFEFSPRYRHCIKAIEEYETQILDSLDEKGKELFKQYSKMQCETDVETGTQRFVYGYSLGVLMTTEVFQTVEKSTRRYE